LGHQARRFDEDVEEFGAVTPAEVARNVDAFARPVPAALWGDLVAAGLLSPDAPMPR
jgi:D-threo-aldose 1-dehydrogenase